ncbi:Phosphatase YwpJ [Sporomusa rhizae]|uniref:Cof-type HAD-IIB family hydrolase n=1 Tax=Sporomusa rhizae TaxID=357999 RepID=UPI00352A389A
MKLFVTDLDGTLLNSQHEISPENLSALELAQKEGLEIAIATGRTYADARAVCEKAGISAHIISNNGSFIFTRDGKKLKAMSLAKEFVAPSLRWLHNNDYYYEISTDNTIFLSPTTEDVLKLDFARAKAADPSLDPAALDKILSLIYSQKGIRIVKDIDSIVDTDIEYYNMLGLSFDPVKLTRGRNYFSNLEGLTMLISGQYNFEMINSNASKGFALKHLTDHLNIPVSKTIAIGDSFNDLSMLEIAGIGVAMGNAEDKIKKCCQYVAKSNDESGVAHIIHELKHLF